MSVAIAAACVACGCAKAESDAEAAPARFPVAPPRIQDVVVERTYVADVRATKHAEVRSRMKGVIEAVKVDEGEGVKAGQVMFVINARTRAQDAAVARAAVLGAEAELRAAELELENTTLLAEKNIVSAAELARVRAKVDLHRARVAEGKATLGRTRVELDRAKIRAPFDGVVNRIRYKAGAVIDEEALLTTISDPREVVAYFAISEREYLAYAHDKTPQRPVVQLALADGSIFAHEGAIDAIGSEIDADTGTLSYRARFPNPEGTLKHGSSGKVILKTKLANALLVPQRATFEAQGDVYVYVVDPDGAVRARKLDVQHRHADAFVVERLEPGERIVLEGVQRLKDGMQIEPITPAVRAPVGVQS